MEQETKQVITKSVILATSLIALSSLAFSNRVRKQMVQRDKTCQWDKSGTKHIGNLHASHINHSREDIIIDGEVSGYNDLNRGSMFCLAHHLEYHSMYAGRAKEIGLTESNNNRAICSLKATLVKFIEENV